VTEALPLTLGTAGHIDHGKTALIRALTGRDTDRLPEEKARGISIALGYARLELPSGRALSVVDVPGHERFVRTMVAGATGIDCYLLCVAADDGVMPQTREHLAVLRGLGVEAGVVAVTKADLADPSRALSEARELVGDVEAVAVSARTGEGLGELLAALDRVAAAVASRAERAGPAVLHVDRSFTLRGIGTVVTGTLWSGAVAAGDEVRILPRGLEARVRSVQVHDAPVGRALAGQRVALALAGPSWREIARGDVVCAPDAELEPTYRIDARLELEPGLPPLERGTRVQVHHGTREAPARVVPLGGGFAQLRLEAPLVPRAGDRVVLRRIAPPDTLGGGTVVDAAPRRHGPSAEVVARLRALERGKAPPEPQAPAAAPEPPRPARPAPELDGAALRIAALLRADGERPRADGDLAAAAGLEPAQAAKRLAALRAAGKVVRVARNLHYDAEVLEGLLGRVVAICERDGSATIASVRDELGTSRRYAQALLEHLDAEKVTLRRGDEHVLRRRPAGGGSPAAPRRA
jgi:selenocysteine-specific elongation factor